MMYVVLVICIKTYISKDRFLSYSVILLNQTKSRKQKTKNKQYDFVHYPEIGNASFIELFI